MVKVTHRNDSHSSCRRPIGPTVLVWTCAENLASTGNRSQNRPARSNSLYRMSCPVPWRSAIRIVWEHWDLCGNSTEIASGALFPAISPMHRRNVWKPVTCETSLKLAFISWSLFDNTPHDFYSISPSIQLSDFLSPQPSFSVLLTPACRARVNGVTFSNILPQYWAPLMKQSLAISCSMHPLQIAHPSLLLLAAKAPRYKTELCMNFLGSAVGWGTALQVGRWRVRFPMVSLEFFIDIILPAALWPWSWHSL